MTDRTRALASILPAAVLLAGFALAGLRLAERQSITNDEPGHFAAGLSYWRSGGYSLTTDNFFFTQKWAAWPLAHRPDLALPSAAEQRKLELSPNAIGQTILTTGAGDPRTLVAPARRMTLLLGIALGCLVWLLTLRIGGRRAALFAVLLYATCPVVLASATLVTSDLGMALWYVAAVGAYAWLLEAPGAIPATLTGVAGGMLLLSKLSGVALGPVAAICLGVHAVMRRGRIPWGRLAAWHLVAAAIAVATIWAFFGFSYRPGGMASEIGHGKALFAAARWRLLPEPFLAELARSARMVSSRPAYLLGGFFPAGRWYYFPVAFLAKSTLAMLGSLALAGIEGWSWLRSRRERTGPAALRLMVIVLGAGVFFALAMSSSVNIGVRHILPVFPLVAIIGGVALARSFARGRPSRLLVAVLVAAGLAEGVRASSRPQSWFNAAAGGPSAGSRIIVDSSLDWGGELPDLLAWEKKLRTRDRETPLFFSDLGALDASCYGSSAQDIALALCQGRLQPGYFVFSATRLVCGPATVFGPWTEVREAAWQHAKALLLRPNISLQMADIATARIAAYCRLRPPLERIGPVYFVYRLDQKALGAALFGPGPVPGKSYSGIPER